MPKAVEQYAPRRAAVELYGHASEIYESGGPCKWKPSATGARFHLRASHRQRSALEHRPSRKVWTSVAVGSNSRIGLPWSSEAPLESSWQSAHHLKLMRISRSLPSLRKQVGENLLLRVSVRDIARDTFLFDIY